MWLNFLSPIQKTPQSLGIDLGTKPYFTFLELPFEEQILRALNLGDSELWILNSKEALLKSQNNDTIGISQVIVFLDCLIYKEPLNDPLTPKYFQKFTVQGKTFSELTEKAIELIKETPEVTLFFTEDYNGLNFGKLRIAFTSNPATLADLSTTYEQQSNQLLLNNPELANCITYV